MADLINPRDYYFHHLKDEVYNNAIEYFEELVNKSGVNRDGNIATVKEINAKKAELEVVNNIIKKYRTIKGFLIFLVVVFLLAGLSLIIYGASGSATSPTGFILGGVGALALGIVFIIVICTSINKKIKEQFDPKSKLESEIAKLTQEAWAQMSSLNNLYDYDLAIEVFNMSIDSIIKMDKRFDTKKYRYVNEKFGFRDACPDKDNESTVLVRSGSILGNPFMLYKNFVCTEGTKTYEGTLTIHWTTTRHTENGTVTEHHTETLHAYVDAMCPYYSYITHLVYGNEAAPNLIFSRGPSRASGKDEKQIDRMVNKETKRLDKKAKKELMDDDPTTNYTRFVNDEFEALFGGTDRNNEVEYRLLFTPIAIQNELSLIKNKEPYGDDFFFEKHKMINIITSKHSQTFDYSSNPDHFISYSYELSKEAFINYVCEFAKSVYFDLAPLISIPLYQMHESKESIYGRDDYDSNYSQFEHESIINEFPNALLVEPTTTTDAIFKARFSEKDGASDRVYVDSYSYRGEPRLTYVSKLGGDGHMHSVPVHWVEYIPVENRSYVGVSGADTSRKEYREVAVSTPFREFLSKYSNNDTVYKRGIIAAILDNPQVQKHFDFISNYFKGIYNNSGIKNNSNSNINNNSNNSQNNNNN